MNDPPLRRDSSCYLNIHTTYWMFGVRWKLKDHLAQDSSQTQHRGHSLMYCVMCNRVSLLCIHSAFKTSLGLGSTRLYLNTHVHLHVHAPDKPTVWQAMRACNSNTWEVKAGGSEVHSSLCYIPSGRLTQAIKKMFPGPANCS